MKNWQGIPTTRLILGGEVMVSRDNSALAFSTELLNYTLLQNKSQVIPGNLQKYISTNRSLRECKTLPAHFSNNMTVYCLLKRYLKAR